MNDQAMPEDFAPLMEDIWRICVSLIAVDTRYPDYLMLLQTWSGRLSASEREYMSWPMLRLIGNMVWHKVPQPRLRYALSPAVKTERNAPCPCHSGRKYKQCCLPLEQAMPPLPEVNFLPLLLEALPRKRWAELAGSQVSVDMVHNAAIQWNDEQRAKDVCTLLEPWFVADTDFCARREGLFVALLDAYTELPRPRKKAQLLDRALAEGDRRMRSAAMQRRATMLADEGDYRAAWRLFAEAQRADPQSPDLSHLEIVLLISEGREAEARERARFWAHRLAAMRDPELAYLIDLMREVSERGAAALHGASLQDDPAFDELLTLLQSAPPIASLYALEPDAETAGPLEPKPALRKALQAWDEAIGALQESWGLGQDAQDEGDSIDHWLPVLRAHPSLWNAFEVLETVAGFVREYAVGLSDEAIVRPVLERSEQLLREVLRANHADGKRFEWGWVENRPALRLLGHRIVDAEEGADPADQLARLEWLVCGLNPNDNQGFRPALVRAYLAAGRAADALALCERYPDDFAAMQYNQVLALFALNRHGEALNALQSAVAAYPKLLAWLLKAKPKAPPMSPYGVSMGGDDEAWYYRQETLALWEQLGALAWLRASAKTVQKRS